MKKLLVVLSILFISLNSSADMISPQEVVRNLIDSVHENNLNKLLKTADLIKIANFPRHGHTPNQLIKILKEINPDEIEFQEGREFSTTVRLLKPLCLDFELEFIERTDEAKDNYYIVIAVHP